MKSTGVELTDVTCCLTDSWAADWMDTGSSLLTPLLLAFSWRNFLNLLRKMYREASPWNTNTAAISWPGNSIMKYFRHGVSWEETLRPEEAPYCRWLRPTLMRLAADTMRLQFLNELCQCSVERTEARHRTVDSLFKSAFNQTESNQAQTITRYSAERRPISWRHTHWTNKLTSINKTAGGIRTYVW